MVKMEDRKLKLKIVKEMNKSESFRGQPNVAPLAILQQNAIRFVSVTVFGLS
jgi:hypothetical protein